MSEILRLPSGSARILFQKGEMNIVTPFLNSLRGKEHESLTKFFGKEINVPFPPKELMDVLVKAKEIGWSQAEAHFLPKMTLEQNTDLPGWKTKPRDWYWQKMKEGSIAKDAATLSGTWVIIDGAQKPRYKNEGIQMYENDPFAQVLTRLRNEGKIQVPDWCKNIPKGSRFGISNNELETHVNPAIANLLGVHPEQVRLPKAIEFNILGNLYHSVWGKTNTWEWFQDTFADGSCLVGGDSSNNGGVAYVAYGASGYHGGSIGFRPLVTFPASPAGGPPKGNSN